MKKGMLKLLCMITVVMFTTAHVMAQSNSELKSKIEKINKEMAEAMVSGNMEKSSAYYTQDVISMPNNSKMMEGKDAMKKSDEEMKKSGMKITSFETTTTKVMSCDKMITEIGTYKISGTMPGKTEHWNDNGKYLTIWEKQADGSLKIKIQIWNTDTNPMAMGNM